MKIRFLERPLGRPEYQKGQTCEFNGAIDEGYARKYIARGWAELVDDTPAQMPSAALAAETGNPDEKPGAAPDADAGNDPAPKDDAGKPQGAKPDSKGKPGKGAAVA